ncbi:Glu-tRNAGln amidotransferase, C subunit [mine drainage metagenome]|uniref:Glu-tRNAGln amidotransferase, C subunit n=1 Tax=mine drainage metagenome TaxID=410659 RepID=T1BEG7_9ZZZZ
MVDFQKVDKEMLERICKNAKLELTDSEIEKFVSEMGSILTTFKTLGEVDTKGVPPAYHPTGIKNVWREDRSEKKHMDISNNTDAIEDGYIVGPKLV